MIKEPHFTPQRMLNMLGLKPDSLGPYALVPGPKERSDLLLKLLASPQKSFTFLDYEMYTGVLDGKRVSVGNGGRYAPDTAITTEILCGAGAEALIRVGSCGSLQDNVKIGDLVIVTGALRGDGNCADSDVARREPRECEDGAHAMEMSCPQVETSWLKRIANSSPSHHTWRDNIRVYHSVQSFYCRAITALRGYHNALPHLLVLCGHAPGG